MVKKQIRCISLNKIKTNISENIFLVKHGNARNLLMSKKNYFIVDKRLDADKIANVKIMHSVKSDIERVRSLNNIKIELKANKSGTLYETLTVGKLSQIIKSKSNVSSMSIFSLKILSLNGEQLSEIKNINKYSLLVSYAKEEIKTISLQIQLCS